MIDSLLRIFGSIIADARRELVERSWFGRAEPREIGIHDEVRNEDHYRDKATGRGLLGLLETVLMQDRSQQPPQSSHEIDR